MNDKKNKQIREAAELPVVGESDSESPFTLPENFAWTDPDTWPSELRQLYEYAALMSLLALRDQGMRMLDVQIDGTDEPVTMLFAIGERAEELRKVWLSVRALHHPSDRPLEQSLSPDSATAEQSSPSSSSGGGG